MANLTSNELLREGRAAHAAQCELDGCTVTLYGQMADEIEAGYVVRSSLHRVIERLERENAELRHDIERALANHTADVTADETTAVQIKTGDYPCAAAFDEWRAKQPGHPNAFYDERRMAFQAGWYASRSAVEVTPALTCDVCQTQLSALPDASTFCQLCVLKEVRQLRGDLKTTMDVLQDFDGEHVWQQAQAAVAEIGRLRAVEPVARTSQRVPPRADRAVPDEKVRCKLCDAGILAGEVFNHARECCEDGKRFDIAHGVPLRSETPVPTRAPEVCGCPYGECTCDDGSGETAAVKR